MKVEINVPPEIMKDIEYIPGELLPEVFENALTVFLGQKGKPLAGEVSDRSEGMDVRKMLCEIIGMLENNTPVTVMTKEREYEESVINIETKVGAGIEGFDDDFDDFMDMLK